MNDDENGGGDGDEAGRLIREIVDRVLRAQTQDQGYAAWTEIVADVQQEVVDTMPDWEVFRSWMPSVLDRSVREFVAKTYEPFQLNPRRSFRRWRVIGNDRDTRVVVDVLRGPLDMVEKVLMARVQERVRAVEWMRRERNEFGKKPFDPILYNPAHDGSADQAIMHHHKHKRVLLAELRGIKEVRRRLGID
jgi:hypothetical protein